MGVRFILIYVLVVFAASNCISQNKDHYKKYGLFFNHACENIYSTASKLNETSYVFADNVNLRLDSTQNGKILEKIKQGDKVEVLDFTTSYTYKISGHGEPWIKIKTENENIGYVYGALITKNYLKYDLNKNGIEELILLGNDFTNPPYGRLKIIENQELLANQTIDSICIDANCETLVMLRILKDPSLSNKEIIEIGTGSNYCQSVWTSNYYYYNNQHKLDKLFVETIGGRFNTSVFLPSDKAGRDGQIVVKKKIVSLISNKLLFEVEKQFKLGENKIFIPQITSNLKEDLIELGLNIGDTIRTNQFYNNKGNKGLISPEDLNKIIKEDNGIFKIAEIKDLLLLGDYSNEGESVEVSMMLIRKLDFEVLNIHRIAKEVVWEHGYSKIYSVYDGGVNFEIIQISGSKDFGDYKVWKRDTTRIHFNSN